MKHLINILYSDDDECYISTIPHYPGLSAFGDTPEEAAKEIMIALEGFENVLKEDDIL